MYEFSVEQAANKINDYRSKDYFREVMNNYFNANYRSSVVMLWTVVICDLVYKLQYLRDIYNDSKATSILDEMIDFQSKNPANPTWEINLLKEVYNRTNLLELHEYDALQNLQKHRHLSAHPVINKSNILFKPNRELVLSDIRLALEAVLTKPPILTKEIFNELVQDLEKIKELFPQDEQLKRYLSSKFYANLNNEVSTQIFKSLWRVTFKANDAKCNDNRNINHRALRILFEEHRDTFTDFIKTNSAYFSEISDNQPLRFAIFFLGDFPHVFNLLTDATKEFIKAKAFTDINLLTVSYFVSKDISEHIDTLIGFININHKKSFGDDDCIIHKNHIADILKHATSAGIKNKVNKLLTVMYVNCKNFDAGDLLFSNFIRPYIDDFNEEDILELINGIDDNNQTYWRSRATVDHQLIVDKAISIVPSFDVTKFKCLPQPKP